MPFRNVLLSALTSFAICTAIATPTSAASLVFYAGRALYDAAATTTATIGFEVLAPANYFTR